MNSVLVIIKTYYLNSFLVENYISNWPSGWHFCIVPTEDISSFKIYFSRKNYTGCRVNIVQESDLHEYLLDAKSKFNLFHVLSDDAVMAVPKNNNIEKFLSSRTSVATFHFSREDVFCKEVYSPKKYITPDNYLSGVILKSDVLLDYIDDILESNNRWLGHSVTFKSYRKGRKVLAFRDADAILPCVNQIAGSHVKKNRSLANSIIIKFGCEISSLGLANCHAHELISDCCCNDLLDESHKELIDNYLSSLTRWAVSSLDFMAFNFSPNRFSLDNKKVVIFKVECIGDVITTTPFFDAVLRSNAAEVVLVTTEAVRSIFDGDDRYSKVIYLPVSRKKGRFSKELFSYLEEDLHKLRPHINDFDVAIFPRYCIDTNLFRFISVILGIEERIGLDVDPAALEVNILYDRMLTKCYRPPYDLHETERMLWFANQLDLCTENSNRLNIGIKSDNDGSNLIVVGLGAASADRRWPKEHYVTLIKIITLRFPHLKVSLLGGVDVADDASYIERNVDVSNLVGVISLMDCARIISKSIVYIGNDSGLMHICSAVGTPIIEISKHPMTGYQWHANSSKRFGPWGVSFSCVQPVIGRDDCTLWCKEKYAHCICDITPEDVYKHFSLLYEDIYREGLQ